jgi:hypothetical protein
MLAALIWPRRAIRGVLGESYGLLPAVRIGKSAALAISTLCILVLVELFKSEKSV